MDKDDLPAGRSYDEQIELAVAKADLFVFLISAELVAPGRFTLTELEFARRRWRRADGHVLPVMVADTNLDLVPPFLTSVNILQPAGNISAEVSSAVAMMAASPQAGHIVPAALSMGAIAGFLTVYFPFPLDTIPADPEKAGFVIHAPHSAPLGAPVFFCIGLAVLFAYFERLTVAKLPSIVLGVFLGWLLAINLFFNINSSANISGDSADVERARTIMVVAIGAMCGAVGAVCTWAGAALVVHRLRRVDATLPSVFVGAVFGSLLYATDSLQQMWILLCPWQAAVAGTIAWSLSRTPR